VKSETGDLTKSDKTLTWKTGMLNWWCEAWKLKVICAWGWQRKVEKEREREKRIEKETTVKQISLLYREKEIYEIEITLKW